MDWVICDEGSLTIDGDVTLNPNGGNPHLLVEQHQCSCSLCDHACGLT